MTNIPDEVPAANATHSNGWLAVMRGIAARNGRR